MDVLQSLNKLGNISSEFSLGFNRGFQGEVGLGMVDMPIKRKVDPYQNIWPENYGGQSAFTNQKVNNGLSAFGTSQETMNDLSNRNNEYQQIVGTPFQ